MPGRARQKPQSYFLYLLCMNWNEKEQASSRWKETGTMLEWSCDFLVEDTRMQFEIFHGGLAGVSAFDIDKESLWKVVERYQQV